MPSTAKTKKMNSVSTVSWDVSWEVSWEVVWSAMATDASYSLVTFIRGSKASSIVLMIAFMPEVVGCGVEVGCGVVWRGVVWCGAVWRGAVWRGEVR